MSSSGCKVSSYAWRGSRDFCAAGYISIGGRKKKTISLPPGKFMSSSPFSSVQLVAVGSSQHENTVREVPKPVSHAAGVVHVAVLGREQLARS